VALVSLSELFAPVAIKQAIHQDHFGYAFATFFSTPAPARRAQETCVD
jgi:hypothetical protein